MTTVRYVSVWAGGGAEAVTGASIVPAAANLIYMVVGPLTSSNTGQEGC